MANRTYKINGETFTLTDEQEAIEVAKEVAHAQDKPMEDWKLSMQETDSGMPRYLEDLITDKFDGNAGPNLQVRYDTKIELRGTKP
jgi:hypothetical protein